MLKIRRDFEQLQQHSDDENSASKTTIANSKVISVKIKRNVKAMKRRSMGKMTKSNIFRAANKRNSSIRKIHIRIEKSIHITTNHCHLINDDFVEGQKKVFLGVDSIGNDMNNGKIIENIINQDKIIEIFPQKRQLFELAMIFGVRILKELLMM